MNHLVYRTELLLALPLAPFFGYLWLYLVSRVGGVLRVSGRGWHAESVYFGDRILLPALLLFALFEVPMRVESAIVRALSRLGAKGAQEQLVSDVVVELIPIA